ncbi:MAG: hypothetical protein J3K34DRAFT_517533 [Monoraphidium minutum]|nr:MAG: hypothetical protein J3K34DRAFT_517533 [Monoraphidium minutum]
MEVETETPDAIEDSRQLLRRAAAGDPALLARFARPADPAAALRALYVTRAEAAAVCAAAASAPPRGARRWREEPLVGTAIALPGGGGGGGGRLPRIERVAALTDGPASPRGGGGPHTPPAAAAAAGQAAGEPEGGGLMLFAGGGGSAPLPLRALERGAAPLRGDLAWQRAWRLAAAAAAAAAEEEGRPLGSVEDVLTIMFRLHRMTAAGTLDPGPAAAAAIARPPDPGLLASMAASLLPQAPKPPAAADAPDGGAGSADGGGRAGAPRRRAARRGPPLEYIPGPREAARVLAPFQELPQGAAVRFTQYPAQLRELCAMSLMWDFFAQLPADARSRHPEPSLPIEALRFPPCFSITGVTNGGEAPVLLALRRKPGQALFAAACLDHMYFRGHAMRLGAALDDALLLRASRGAGGGGGGGDATGGGGALPLSDALAAASPAPECLEMYARLFPSLAEFVDAAELPGGWRAVRLSRGSGDADTDGWALVKRAGAPLLGGPPLPAPPPAPPPALATAVPAAPAAPVPAGWDAGASLPPVGGVPAGLLRVAAAPDAGRWSPTAAEAPAGAGDA